MQPWQGTGRHDGDQVGIGWPDQPFAGVGKPNLFCAAAEAPLPYVPRDGAIGIILSGAAPGVTVLSTVSNPGRRGWSHRAADRSLILRESISELSPSCPCPYNTDRAGRRCGARSAYSRPGGRSPFCYEQDVTQKMVDDYRNRTGQ